MISGDYIRVHYNDDGLWNNLGEGAGLQISDDGLLWRDVTWPGNPWQLITVEYTAAGTPVVWTGNTAGANWTTLLEEDLSIGAARTARYTYEMGLLEIVRTDTWEAGGRAIRVGWEVTNTGVLPISDLRIMHSLEPDQDYDPYSTTYGSDAQLTFNDVLDLSGDGAADWVESEGYVSGWTVGYGMCSAAQEGGHTQNWSSDADARLLDYAGVDADAAMHLRHTAGSLASGQSISFSFVFAWDTTPGGAQDGYAAEAPNCGVCDADGDGHLAQGCGGDDCDDFDPGAATADLWYADVDGDGYGDLNDPVQSCSRPAGYVRDATDCDDGDAAVNPGAVESCNGVDDDCDGADDEASAVDAATWYADDDSDGYGDASTAITSCAQPTGYTSDSSDCDDADGAIHPAAREVCDGADNDCDGAVDEAGALGESAWYVDGDGDGYGDPGASALACDPPAGAVADGSDCDDAAAVVNPGAQEICDGVDNDCDGAVDEAGASGESAWYVDGDGDGYGDPASEILACDPPAGRIADGSDCDDADPQIYPGRYEVQDGTDNDCDGDVDNLIDGDGDGLSDEQERQETGTDPADPDSDGDGHPDGDEIRDGTDPNDPADPGADDTGADDTGDDTDDTGDDDTGDDDTGDDDTGDDDTGDDTGATGQPTIWYQGGLACSSAPGAGGAALLPLALAGALARRRRR